jgi:hypothetical protein
VRDVPLTWVKPFYTLKIRMSTNNLEDVRLKVLRSAPLNSWIALSEDESKIVAVGTSYDEVVVKSENAGVSDPVLIKTPKSWLPISV